MDDKHRGGSHGWLFPIVALVLLSKAMHHGRRHRAWMGAAGPEGDSGAGFRVPPRIESMLDAWHERAHRATDPAEAPTA